MPDEGFGGFDLSSLLSGFEGFDGGGAILLGGGGNLGSLESVLASLSQGSSPVQFEQGRPIGGQFGNFLGGVQRPGGETNLAGTPITLSSSAQALEQFNNDPKFLEQFAKSLASDMVRQQGASDRQFERNQAATAAIEDLVGGIRGRFEGLAEGQAGRLKEVADSLLGRSENIRMSFDEASERLLGDVKDEVRGATRAAGRAVSEARRVEREFQDNSAALAVNAGIGIKRNARAAQEMIQAGLLPDGTLMSPEQQAQAQFALQRDVAEQTFVVKSSLAQSYNESKAALASNVVVAQQNLANVRLGGAQLIGQVGTALQDQSVRLEGIGAQQSQLAANLNVIGEQLRSSAQLSATQFEMQGRLSIAQLISNNVEGVVSVFAGLSSLFGALTAPGAGNIPAVDLGFA